MATGTSQAKWTPAHVSSAVGPELIARTYIEQREIRQILSPLGRFARACEVGAGYGRLTPVLAEHADAVQAYEHEVELAYLGQQLYPSIEFRSLAQFTDANGIDLAMTFTFLQHLSDHHAMALSGVIADGVRYALLAEECNPSYAVSHDDGRFTQGRAIETYGAWLAPMKLIRTQVRHYDRPSPVGHHPMYLLFAR